MTTSSSRNFISTRDEIIAYAYRKLDVIGPGDTPSANQVTQASAVLNAMVLEWQNDGIGLWTLIEDTVKLTASTATVTLDECVDIDNVLFRRNEGDTPLHRLTRPEYRAIQDKTTEGTPTSYYVDFQLAAPVLYLYPVPENTTGCVTGTDALIYLCSNDHTSATATDKPITGTDYADYWTATTDVTATAAWANATDYYSDVIKYTKYQRLQDFDGASDNPDFPVRWYQALIWGLAAELAPENGIVDAAHDKILMRASRYYQRAKGSDTDMGDLRISPRIR